MGSKDKTLNRRRKSGVTKRSRFFVRDIFFPSTCSWFTFVSAVRAKRPGGQTYKWSCIHWKAKGKLLAAGEIEQHGLPVEPPPPLMPRLLAKGFVESPFLASFYFHPYFQRISRDQPIGSPLAFLPVYRFQNSTRFSSRFLKAASL